MMVEFGWKICDMCRTYFPKSELVANRRGQFCRPCWKEYKKGKDKFERGL